jgi:hypothetical protein
MDFFRVKESDRVGLGENGRLYSFVSVRSRSRTLDDSDPEHRYEIFRFDRLLSFVICLLHKS